MGGVVIGVMIGGVATVDVGVSDGAGLAQRVWSFKLPLTGRLHLDQLPFRMLSGSMGFFWHQYVIENN